MDLERKLNVYSKIRDENQIADYINHSNKAVDIILGKKYFVREISSNLFIGLGSKTGEASNHINIFRPVKDKITSQEIINSVNESGLVTYTRLISISEDQNDINPVTFERTVLFSNDGNMAMDDEVKIKGNADYAMDVFHIVEELYHRAIEKPSKKIEKQNKEKIEFLSPKEIHSKLDEYVIGQDSAKKGLAVAVSNHYKKLLNGSNFEKNNIMLIGPTGSGKTLLAKTIAKTTEVPFVITEAPEYTSEGYVGKKVNEMFYRLVKAANFDFEKAEKGIIYVDEIDKVRESFGHGPDVNGGGVQDALLRKMEECEVEIPLENVNIKDFYKGMATTKTKKFKTDNVLFIFGGAFTELDKIKAASEKSSNQIGYCPRNNERSKSLLVDALHEYGMKREFLGRIPTILNLEKLSTEEMKEILYKPKNAVLGQYQEMCKQHGIELEITEDGLTRIAEEADKLSLGARSLRTVLDILVNPIIYENSGSNTKVTLDRDTIEKFLKD